MDLCQRPFLTSSPARRRRIPAAARAALSVRGSQAGQSVASLLAGRAQPRHALPRFVLGRTNARLAIADIFDYIIIRKEEALSSPPEGGDTTPRSW